jgi:hypothetical protein
MANIDQMTNFERIPYLLGFLVLDENGTISSVSLKNIFDFFHFYLKRLFIKSGGELENDIESAKLAYKIAMTAAKIPVNPNPNQQKESFKRISSN